MDQESIVYGVVRDVAWGNDASRWMRLDHNRAVIESLPPAEGGPLLSRDMFGISGHDDIGAAYHTQIIHFGASYRAIEYEWESWMEQFEKVLKQMYWVAAKVHLETELSGNHVFIWEPTGDFHEPHSPLSVRCEWEHEGLNRHFR